MIRGVTAEVRESAEGESYLMVKSETPLFTLNSSIWGAGFGLRRHIVNRQVDKDYDSSDPVREMEAFLRKQGFEPSSAAGLLTAAHVSDHGYCRLALDEAAGDSLHVASWATVGLGNQARAGLTQAADKLFPGTINLIVVVDGILTEGALVNAVITATEAKTAALQDLGVRLPGSDEIATGTTTDAVAIASTMRGTRYGYAGTGTHTGYLVGKTVYNAVTDSASRYLEAAGHRKRMRAQ